MKKQESKFAVLLGSVMLLILAQGISLAQSKLDCGMCHSTQKTLWMTSQHARTQTDVAGELAANWKGQRPDSVILGSQAENCVSCHGPTAVATGAGMTEVQVMAHFFTTKGGIFTDSTVAADTTNWPHVYCVACHNVPASHPVMMPTLSAFNSTTTHYDSVQTSSQICGKCHGTLRFADTDHRIFDGWRESRHGHGNQGHLAGELAASWAGQRPDSVINGSQAENCITCHSPTAVNRKTGVTEVQVLARFFTTTAGVFTANTTVADTTHWQDVSCNTCHNPHNPGAISFFDSRTGSYQTMSSSNQLCGQCHGRLRFPDTDHGSYDIETGTGGIGVPNKVTMPGVKCIDCHMYKTDSDGSNSLMLKGHSWSVFIDEPDGSMSAACASCHKGMGVDAAAVKVTSWKQETARLDSLATLRVAAAENFLRGGKDTLKLRYLAEAQYNLLYAELDESGGVHNHLYVVSLLNHAIQKASSIVTGIQEEGTPTLPKEFGLLQNYPNPFNPSTIIQFDLPKRAHLSLKIFNMLGQQVATLIDESREAGTYKLQWSPQSLPSGMYLYRLRAGDFEQTRKLLLLK